MKVDSLKADIETLWESGDQEEIEDAINTACDVHGIFLGTTNGSGKAKYAFEDTGNYLLVTCKPGFFPGWKPIVILEPSETDSV